MKLAISNIAWDAAEDDAVAQILRREGVDGIEIAPTKWRADPLRAAAADIVVFRESWLDRGLPIVAMQALLFGKDELQLFGTAPARNGMLDHLRRMLDFARAVGAGAVVFGSPRNRRRGTLDLSAATNIAADFLHALAPHAQAAGVAFCVEPVPARYGCDFINTPAEALSLVERVNAPGILVNADLGAMTLTRDDVAEDVRAARAHIGHFHASETDFVPLADATLHAEAAAALRAIEYNRWVSIEMKSSADSRNLASIAGAVRLARTAYPK